MKILVTGGTGTVGSQVVRELLAARHAPRGFEDFAMETARLWKASR